MKKCQNKMTENQSKYLANYPTVVILKKLLRQSGDGIIPLRKLQQMFRF